VPTYETTCLTYFKLQLAGSIIGHQCLQGGDATRRPRQHHDGMTHTTCTCPLGNDLLLGQSDGHILRVPQGAAQPTQHYRFSGAPVQWLLATPDGRTVAAGHACGLVIAFDALTGHAQERNTGQRQSEDKATPAHTTGLLSADGRWLLAYDQREDKDVGFLVDLQQQHAPRRQVLPKASLSQQRRS
jgi:hypothetical protein